MLWSRCAQLGAGAALIVSSLASASTSAATPAAAAARPGAAPLAGAAAGPGRPGLPVIRPGIQVAPVTPGATQPAVAGPVAHATSTNWSGYAASGAFSKVSASWAEPAGTCSGGGSRYASIWAGLDGYNSSTVEQVGSEVDCSGAAARYYSWYEMYPSPPVNFSNPVQPGDHFTGTVTHNGGGSYTLTLTDTTRGWSHIINATQTRAATSSAEVIAEAPSSSRGVLPLADFGTVHFSGATVDGSPLGNADPVQIVMVDSAGRDKDTVSALSGGQNFSVTWQRSN
jgi:hypothetical protein